MAFFIPVQLVPLRALVVTQLANSNNNLTSKPRTGKAKTTPAMPFQNSDDSPRAALERVEWRLRNEEECGSGCASGGGGGTVSWSWWCALEDDVQRLLQPGKLARRKDVLRDILSTWFDLRGQCVPVRSSSGNNGARQFATQCTVAELGDFVLQTVQERKRELQQMSLSSNKDEEEG